MQIKDLVQSQQQFFISQKTKDISFRKENLLKLQAQIKENIPEITEALKKDLNKSEVEAYMTEIEMVLSEIKETIHNLSKWAKPKRVKTKLFLFPSKSYIYKQPYGVVLIMSPWNYPFQLTMAPLIGALAAGNCAILKPSNYSPNVSAIINKIISKVFTQDYVCVVQGGRDANSELLEQKFDYIFFTGGVTVGKLVMEKAAKNLTPISLELGGKSPCIVDETANIQIAAKRIVWGKFLNAGQTCIAPDYVLVIESVKEQLLAEISKQIKVFFDNKIQPSFPKIITEKHFARISKFIDNSDKTNGSILCGGLTDSQTQQISPTVLVDSLPDSPVMSEEIFGPVLPIISMKSLSEVISFVQNRPHPLALYFFTQSKKNEKLIINSLEYGGGCINDTIMHVSTSNMPFGGVGNSGMGNYHGKWTFDTFSHTKSVLHNTTSIDMDVRYLPYTKSKTKIIKTFLN